MSEFVMVKRELLERVASDKIGMSAKKDREAAAFELRAVLAREAGKVEPILIQAVAVTREDDDEGLRLEWLLEGGIAEMEFPGMMLFALPDANDLCDEDGSAEIYTSPPAPVSVVLSDEQILEVMRPAIYRADGGYVFDTAKEDVIAAGRALIDKLKELNQ